MLEQSTGTSAATSTAPVGLPLGETADPRRWRMLPVILTATFMALFDFFVVNVAAPSFQQDLHASQSELQLVVGGYAFSYATGLITGGRLGDLFGYRRFFIGGMAGFVVASLLCGVAQNPAELIGARLAQGFTAAAMVPQVLALITATFPVYERPRALSYFGMVIGAGSVAGQIIGGLLLEGNLFGWGWRSIFLVNVPIGILAIGFALRLVPHHRSVRRPRLDVVGAIGVSISLALALVPLVLGQSEGWPLWAWLSLAASVPAMALTVGWEQRLGRKGGEPLIDLQLFRRRSFSAGIAVNGAFMAYFGSFMLGLTLMLQNGLGLDPLQSGLTFGPLGVAFALTSMGSGWLRNRFGTDVITAGAVIAGVGLVVLLIEVRAFPSSVSAVTLVPSMVLMGVGNGMVLPSLIGAVLSGVKPERAGAASGILTTAQQFSSAAGVAALGVVFFDSLGPASAGGDAGISAYVPAMTRLVVFDLVLVGLAMLLSRLLPGTSRVLPGTSRGAAPWGRRQASEGVAS
jgi:EmrB/QacA subfamily drug resistance transporter